MERAHAKKIIQHCFDAAVRAADPASAVERALPDIGLRDLGNREITVLAVGKAAPAMVRGLERGLERSIDRGVLITKDGHVSGALPSSVEVFEASHPVPDERCLAATRRLLEMAQMADPHGLTFVLMSGGGSALLELPHDGVSLNDIADLTKELLSRGATIDQLNAVRSRLSRVKGGGLLRFIGSSKVVTLVLSDVLGNDLSVIASGPTTPLKSTADEAVDILRGFDLWTSLPSALQARIAANHTTAGDQPTPTTRAYIVADNHTAIDAAQSCLLEFGLRSDIVWRGKGGEARDLARAWVETLGELDPNFDAIIGGGEATVTVRGNGIGGRNTEFAVAAALELERREMRDWVIASLATDGDDGPTGAAGGFADASLPQQCRLGGADPHDALAINDSLRALELADSVVVTGPTGTNVNDLYFAVRCVPDSNGVDAG